MSARAIVLAAAVGLVIAGGAACERDTRVTPVQIAVSPAAMARLEARVQKVMRAPEAQRAMDGLFEAVAADPELGKVASRFGDQLLADPDIASAVSGLIGDIGDSPTLVSWVVRYMETHPGTSPTAAGEAVGLEVTKRFSILMLSPVEDEIGRLIENADGGAGLAKLEGHLSGKFGGIVDAYFESPDRKTRWSKRLIELNGGARPDALRAGDLYLDHAWSEERITRFVVRACADPAVRHAVVAFLQRLLEEPALRAHLQRAARTLATDAALRRATIDVFTLLLDDAATPEIVRTEVAALFASPAVMVVVNDLGQNLLGEPALLRVLDEAIREAAEQRSVREAIDELCDGW